MDLSYLKKLVRIVEHSGVDEIEVEEEGLRVRIARNSHTNSVAVHTAAVAPAAAPNVLLVTIDTLRADHVGAYGYAAGETPTLDRLAREGVRLEDAVVQVPQTRPSHACIMTGRLPYEHGIRDNFSPLRKHAVEVLLEVWVERAHFLHQVIERATERDRLQFGVLAFASYNFQQGLEWFRALA